MTSISSERLFDESYKPSTLIELLRWRALRQPDCLAYTFLVDGETEEINLTYGELDRQARAISASLQAQGLSGERILLLYPPGLEFISAFFGCLYTKAVAVPAYPPRPNRNLLRLQAIIEDAQATATLTTTALLSKIEPLLKQVDCLRSLLATDEVAELSEDDWQEPDVTNDVLAFLQYTSGSTGTPKGVMLSHGNLLSNASLVHQVMEHTPREKYISWLPTFHDMGFMAGVLQPLYGGFPAILMSPVSFLQSPFRWLQAISHYQGTTSGGPNFAYDLCIRKISAEQRESLDLSSWTGAFNGAEPIRGDTLERFAATFEQSGFRRETFFPCYGLAEATLMVSGGKKNAPPVSRTFQNSALESNRVAQVDANDEGGRSLVACGAAMPGQKIVVANPETLAECLPDEVGEIWASGPGIAQGYWNRMEETDQTFRAHLSDTGEGPFLRTGDLGFMFDGELFITGRLKDLIIIRGLNHYPQDIELTVERAHPSLKLGGGAAFSTEVAGAEQLVVVHEVERHPQSEPDEIIRLIRQAISDEHEVQAYAVALIKSGTIPKTSSGKIQRRACRVEFLAQKLEIVAMWQEPAVFESDPSAAAETTPLHSKETIEDWLRYRLAAKLGVDVAQIDTTQPITRYGLDSLMAIELMHGLEVGLGLTLPMASFLHEVSIAELAEQALSRLKSNPGVPARFTVDAAAVGEYQPLSYGQQALWFLHKLSPESTAYNIVNAVRLRGDLNVVALRRAFEALVYRHPQLRTTLTTSQGKPVQRVQEQMAVWFLEEDASAWSEPYLNSRLSQDALHPFNLEEGPLLRISLFTQSAQQHVLSLTVHHIVADFWSLAILMHELGVLYQAGISGEVASLTPLPSQYIDYVRWQEEMIRSPEGERSWKFWNNQLSGELPVLHLPIDRLRPPIQSYRGASQSKTLNAEITRALKGLSRAQGATLYTTLLAAFQVLLYRCTGQEDIIVGTPTTGRRLAELVGLVGYFVNPVIIRADLSGDQTFREFLKRMRHSVLQSLEHQDFPFALLVERLQPQRDASRSPLFDVMFVLQKTHLPGEDELASFALGEAGARIKLGELDLEALPLEQQIAQFDLTLMMAEVNGRLIASLQYNADLFEAATIRRMLGHYQTLLEGLVADPDQRLSALPLLSDSESRQQLTEWNATAVDYSASACLHELFEAQVASTPESIALVFEDQQLTYTELNARANQLAHYLQKLGVGPDVLVGVLMERSVEMVVALLGILKAGGAYVPIDPAYPAERVEFMLRDADVAVLVTQQRLVTMLQGYTSPVVCLDTGWEPVSRERAENPASRVKLDNLIAVIYTSGSTGVPKGAMLSHTGIVNCLSWMQATYRMQRTDRFLFKTSLNFDPSIWELFWPLSVGASVCVARPGGQFDSAYLVDCVARDMVTYLYFVPAMLRIFLDTRGVEECRSLKQVICGGDALTRELMERFFTLMTAALHHSYGPTETSIAATEWTCERAGDRQIVPIGRPLGNTQVYVLDRALRPVPVGVAGELYIGGTGVGRGYLNRAVLTAEKFIPDVFSREPGARLYKSGDVVRYLPDGVIEFMGRSDHQVKVRGFRIELGEIEAALRQHPFVRETIIAVREDSSGEKQLVAYIVMHPQDSPLIESEWRDFLKERLPEYMVPTTFVLLESLPLMHNNKVDRRALPAPDRTGLELATGFVAPATPVEEVLAQVWSRVLGIKQVGINNNFFELGGHSLLAMQVISQVAEALDVEVPVRRFFASPTIAELAKVIGEIKESGEQPSTPAIKRVTREAYRVELSKTAISRKPELDVKDCAKQHSQ